MRRPLVPAVAAAVLGAGHAAVTVYWAAGGTALLDTIGGSIERWARDRTPGLVTALCLLALLKLGVALAAPVLATTRLPSWTRGGLPRALSWVAAIVLTLYGGVLTAAGLLVQTGVLSTDQDTDTRALAWHTYLWDPWFLLWGLLLAATLGSTRGTFQASSMPNPGRSDSSR